MTRLRPSLGSLLLLAQIGAAFAAPLAIGFMPPARGAMLLIPLGSTDAIRFARDHDATLIRLGAIPGSVVVLGESARLARDPLHIVAVSATALGCGDFAVSA